MTVVTGRSSGPSPLGTCAIVWREEAGRWTIMAIEHPADGPATDRHPLAQRLLADLAAGRDATWALDHLAWDRSPPFARRVLRRLATVVPRGSTITYGELARLAGRPDAARAVGAAMGRNPFPFLVPCHRVVAADGLGGFERGRRGALARKRALLAWEGAL